MAADLTYTVAAWTAIVGIGSLVYYAVSKNGKRKQRISPVKQTVKKKVVGDDNSGGEARTTKEKTQKKKKRDRIPNVSSSDDTPKIKTAAQTLDSRDEEELNNKEFARQFQNVKSGVISASQTQANPRTKSVKQTQAAIVKSADEDSKSSTTGADGDDDFSATDSPSLVATKINTPQSGGVSDMLEPVSTGPSVLRITESTKPPLPKKEKKPVQEEVKETKKQRQNRKKAETAKLAREEDEKLRRTLMEKQRRTAREAEGRAAKDGSAFMASKAPLTSVWTAPPNTTDDLKSSLANAAPLLDTYEPTWNETDDSSNLKYSTGNKSSSEWEVIPSEEEQIRLLNEDSEWNTVKTKKPKKKAEDSPEFGAAENMPVLKQPPSVRQISSYAALNDEGAGLNDEADAVRIWEDGKGFTKTTPSKTAGKDVRLPRVHMFSYLKEDGTIGLMMSKEPNKEDEWEVS